MNPRRSLLLCSIAALLATTALPARAAERLRVVTPAAPPLFVQEGNTVKGTMVDMYTELDKRAGVTFEFAIATPDRVILELTSKPDACVSNQVQTDDLKDKAQWVLPRQPNRYRVFLNAADELDVKSLDTLKGQDVAAVGLVSQQLLEKAGIKYIPSRDLGATLKMLEVKRVRAVVMADYLLRQATSDPAKFKASMEIASIPAYFACNKAVKPETVTALQTHFKAMQKDGSLARIVGAQAAENFLVGP